uniref:Uncharacterized protein n=1 Tax=Rhizophora mucronata TaxID=61149 RepID=A0A2P2PGT2_RHIMU
MGIDSLFLLEVLEPERLLGTVLFFQIIYCLQILSLRLWVS